MNALLAAKRLRLLLLSLLLILMTGAAIAKDGDHGYLGVMLQNVSTSMAKALQLDEGEGVLINKVIEDSPAAKAGLEDGDVILTIAGKAINDFSALTKAVRATSPGDVVEMEILHNGTRQTAQIEMGKAEKGRFNYSTHSGGDAPHFEFFGEGGDHDVIVMSGGQHSRSWTDEDGSTVVIDMSGDGPHGKHGNVWIGDDEDGEFEVHLNKFFSAGNRGFMGVELDDLNEQMGEYFGIEDGEGALISNVNDDSPAAEAGLKAGDVIVSVNGESVEDAGDVHSAMSDTEPEQEIEVNVVRKGKKKTIKVTLGEMPEGEFMSFMNVPHAPRMMKHFGSRYPGGMDHDIRVRTHRSPRMVRDLHMVSEDAEDLAEMREELDELRKELKELQKDLRK